MSPHSVKATIVRNYRRILCKKGFKKYAGRPGVPKLQIGSGRNVLAGWFNTDTEAFGKEVYFLDAHKRFPFPDASFQYVFMEHCLEHFDFAASLGLLRECHRILRAAGKIRVATPDLQFLLDLYKPEKEVIQEEYIQWAGGRFMGEDYACLDVFVINNFFYSWGHRFIHDFKSLKLALELCGFTGVTRRGLHQSEDNHLRFLERHGSVIPEEFNRLETMVAEASK